MATRTVTIASSVGLHARPAALFVEAASNTGLDVEIARPGDDPVDATSILGVMALRPRPVPFLLSRASWVITRSSRWERKIRPHIVTLIHRSTGASTTQSSLRP